MEIRYEKHWSGWLNRDMEFKIYGSCGKPVIFIPCQAGRFWDFESFKMVDYWAPWIESGKCMVFSIDTIDNESWAATEQGFYALVAVSRAEQGKSTLYTMTEA